MYYKVVERFGPSDKDRWKGYLAWRGLNLTRYDSVDGILRGNLFELENEEAWSNCLVENYKTILITNLEYANKMHQKFEDSDLVGVEISVNSVYEKEHGFLGFDIVDSYWDNSMLTNWGIDEEDMFSSLIEFNGLIHDLQNALLVKKKLRTLFQEDHHAADCDVWAIYDVNT